MNNKINDITDEAEVKLLNDLIAEMGDVLNPILDRHTALNGYYAMQGLYGILAVQMYQFTETKKVTKSMYAKACVDALELQIMEAFSMEESEE